MFGVVIFSSAGAPLSRRRLRNHGRDDRWCPARGRGALSALSSGRLILLALPTALGALLGLSLVAAPHGYAAAYAYGGAMGVSALGLSVAAVLFVLSSTRARGRSTLVATLLFALGFAGLWGTIEMVGLVTWRTGTSRGAIQ